MIYLENHRVTEPHLNLAVEEFLLREVVEGEPILMFYVNDASVIIGRNQNVFEEVDFAFARERGIPVLRRLSGGGTVYHDLGNLNFSLITPGQELLNDYEAFTRPVVNVLRMIGLKAEIRNRSSIFVGNKKISGNAQYATRGKLVSHGTLLLNVDLDRLRKAIRSRHPRVQSRAVQSVRSEVANLSDLLCTENNLDMVKDYIRREFLGSESPTTYQLGDDDRKTIREIAEERYLSWSWNVGRSPTFSTERIIQTKYGIVSFEVLVEKGFIRAIRPIENDARIDSLVLAICECLQGTRFEPADLVAALKFCAGKAAQIGLTVDELAMQLY